MVAVRAKLAGVAMAISRENRCSESEKVFARFAILEYRREVLARLVAQLHHTRMLDLLVVAAPFALSLERVDHGPGVAAQHGLLDLVLGDVDGLLAGFVGDGGQVRALVNVLVHVLVRAAEHFSGKKYFAASLAQSLFDLANRYFPASLFHGQDTSIRALTNGTIACKLLG